MIKIGSEIKKARNTCGLKQGVLAKELYLSKGYMSLIENDKRNLTVDLLISILKKFKNYGHETLLGNIFNKIEHEIIKSNKSKNMEILFNKGFSTIDGFGTIGKVFMPHIYCRYETYVAKDFKTKENEDICLFFVYNIAYVFECAQIAYIKNLKTNKYVSKTEFEKEVKKVKGDFIKYNGAIPKDELFSVETFMLFPKELNNEKFTSLFDKKTHKRIIKDFDCFSELSRK